MRRVYAPTFRAMAAIVMAALVITFGVSTQAQAEDKSKGRDLVLLLDGSGSISASDWRLQLDSYAAALRDASNFPTDGSVAVGVIQWSGSNKVRGTRVEVPLTTLDSTSAVDLVVDDILAIDQINSSTNSGDAVRAGTEMLLSDGRQDARWSLCMSTDGQRNAGESLSSAVTFASSNGVDSYSVIAIEDGGFSGAAARSAYGPYVFGGGSVTVARTTGEFGGLISGCIADPLNLEALEVTQGVQDLENSVSLVHNKRTLVRAYLSPVDQDVQVTTGRLHAYVNGNELDQSPINAINKPSGKVLVDDDPIDRRGEISSTLNFELPDAWTQHNSLTLELEVPGGIVCDESNFGAQCSTVVQFAEGIHLRTHYRGFEWEDDDGDVTRPTWDSLWEQARRAEPQLPASTWWASAAMLRVPSQPDLLAEANDYLLLDTSSREQDGIEHRWIGSIPGPVGEGGGVALHRVASAWADIGDAETHGRNRLVHELGHTLGLHHSVNAEANGTDGWWIFRSGKFGWCGEFADLEAPEYPYSRVISGSEAAALGPSTGPRNEVWGTDPRYVGVDSALAVSSPDETTSLMSYCSGTSAQRRWISAHDYEQLLNNSLEPINGWDSDEAVANDGIVVRAIIAADGTAAQMKPALALGVDPGESDPEGTHQFIVRNEAGDELA